MTWKRPKPIKKTTYIPKPMKLRGWKVDHGWQVSAWRGQGESFQRYKVKVASYEEGVARRAELLPFWNIIEIKEL